MRRSKVRFVVVDGHGNPCREAMLQDGKFTETTLEIPGFSMVTP